jgi:hypothetical protein
VPKVAWWPLRAQPKLNLGPCGHPTPGPDAALACSSYPLDAEEQPSISGRKHSGPEGCDRVQLSLMAAAATGTGHLVVLRFQGKSLDLQQERPESSNSIALPEMTWQVEQLQSIPFPANVTDFAFVKLPRLTDGRDQRTADVPLCKGHQLDEDHKAHGRGAGDKQCALQACMHALVAVRDSNLLRVFPVQLALAEGSCKSVKDMEMLDTSVRLLIP